MATDEEWLSSALLDRELSSVEFVRGYVQLRWDGPCLTVISDPTVFVGSEAYPRDRDGFLERMVGLVGKKVVAVRFRDEVELVIVFATGETFRVPLDDASRTIPGQAEAVVFELNDPEHQWFID